MKHRDNMGHCHRGAAVLGKDLTRARLLGAIQFLGGISNKKLVALKKAWEKEECEALMAKS